MKTWLYYIGKQNELTKKNCAHLSFRESNNSYKVKIHILDVFMYGWADHKSLLQHGLDVPLQVELITSVQLLHYVVLMQTLFNANIALHCFHDFWASTSWHREVKAAKAVPSTGERVQRWEAEQEKVRLKEQHTLSPLHEPKCMGGGKNLLWEESRHCVVPHKCPLPP